MKRPRQERSVFVCRQCGGESQGWLGRCPHCQEWNTLEEVRLEATPPRRRPATTPSTPVELTNVSLDTSERLRLPYEEVNRVLGGGIVPGSVLLLAGEPGIGKSTLLLQVASAASQAQRRVLYISGEESLHQIKVRARRLGVEEGGLYLLCETSVETALGHLSSLKPNLAIVDSIQTMYSHEVPSSSGSVAQVRACAARLVAWAKETNTPIFLTGHVTKEGGVAGPMVLEHMVDAVLFFEGDPHSNYRILRSIKNRFGSTNEIGVFEMGSQGLAEVENPSQAFLSQRLEGSPGSAIACTMQGSRPLLVEVQALTYPSLYSQSRRTANGLDPSRLIMIAAVLSRRVSLPLEGNDLIASAAGGLRVFEPAADLALALAIASSFRDAPVAPRLVAVGEVGLVGELRDVPYLEQRLTEAARLGFRRCLIPTSHHASLQTKEMEVIQANTLREALGLAGISRRRGRTEKAATDMLDYAPQDPEDTRQEPPNHQETSP